MFDDSGKATISSHSGDISGAPVSEAVLGGKVGGSSSSSSLYSKKRSSVGKVVNMNVSLIQTMSSSPSVDEEPTSFMDLYQSPSKLKRNRTDIFANVIEHENSLSNNNSNISNNTSSNSNNHSNTNTLLYIPKNTTSLYKAKVQIKTEVVKSMQASPPIDTSIGMNSSNMNDNMKSNDNMNDHIKSNDNMNDSIKSNDNMNDSIKSNDNMNDSIKSNDNMNDSIKSNDNMNDNIKNNDHIDHIITSSPVRSTTVGSLYKRRTPVINNNSNQSTAASIPMYQPKSMVSSTDANTSEMNSVESNSIVMDVVGDIVEDDCYIDNNSTNDNNSNNSNSNNNNNSNNANTNANTNNNTTSGLYSRRIPVTSTNNMNTPNTSINNMNTSTNTPNTNTNTPNTNTNTPNSNHRTPINSLYGRKRTPLSTPPVQSVQLTPITPASTNISTIATNTNPSTNSITNYIHIVSPTNTKTMKTTNNHIFQPRVTLEALISSEYTLHQCQEYISASPLPLSTPDTFYYPHTKDLRLYQVQMTTAAIFRNCIICLPTGLGKTLIASTLQYNYSCWFPQGLCLFMAHTRPLISQQYLAYSELTGHTNAVLFSGGIRGATPDKREALYPTAQVIFATPQTILADQGKSSFDAQRVSCVVFDEAHHAQGSSAYVKVLELLRIGGAVFRCIGLTATPGGTVDAVRSAVHALDSQRIFFRSIRDDNVAAYLQNRYEATITSPLQGTSAQIRIFHRKRILVDQNQLSIPYVPVSYASSIEKPVSILYSLIQETIKRLVDVQLLPTIDVDQLQRYQIQTAYKKAKDIKRKELPYPYIMVLLNATKSLLRAYIQLRNYSVAMARKTLKMAFEHEKAGKFASNLASKLRYKEVCTLLDTNIINSAQSILECDNYHVQVDTLLKNKSTNIDANNGNIIYIQPAPQVCTTHPKTSVVLRLIQCYVLQGVTGLREYVADLHGCVDEEERLVKPEDIDWSNVQEEKCKGAQFDWKTTNIGNTDRVDRMDGISKNDENESMNHTMNNPDVISKETSHTRNSKCSVLIFTQLREHVDEVVRSLQCIRGLRVSQFIGQAAASSSEMESSDNLYFEPEDDELLDGLEEVEEDKSTAHNVYAEEDDKDVSFSLDMFQRNNSHNNNNNNEILPVSSETAPISIPRLGTSIGPMDQKQCLQVLGHRSKSKGMTQITQSKILNEFKAGNIDVLVCTCVAEEGLDIGEVDQVINMDISGSAVRAIQRRGRTGRQKTGYVINIVGSGAENAQLLKNYEKEEKVFNNMVQVAKEQIEIEQTQFLKKWTHSDNLPETNVYPISNTPRVVFADLVQTTKENGMDTIKYDAFEKYKFDARRNRGQLTTEDEEPLVTSPKVKRVRKKKEETIETPTKKKKKSTMEASAEVAVVVGQVTSGVSSVRGNQKKAKGGTLRGFIETPMCPVKQVWNTKTSDQPDEVQAYLSDTEVESTASTVILEKTPKNTKKQAKKTDKKAKQARNKNNPNFLLTECSASDNDSELDSERDADCYGNLQNFVENCPSQVSDANTLHRLQSTDSDLLGYVQDLRQRQQTQKLRSQSECFEEADERSIVYSPDEEESSGDDVARILGRK